MKSSMSRSRSERQRWPSAATETVPRTVFRPPSSSPARWSHSLHVRGARCWLGSISECLVGHGTSICRRTALSAWIGSDVDVAVCNCFRLGAPPPNSVLIGLQISTMRCLLITHPRPECEQPNTHHDWATRTLGHDRNSGRTQASDLFLLSTTSSGGPCITRSPSEVDD
jgi:hypothetical protein